MTTGCGPLTFHFTQDASGGRALVFNAVFSTAWAPILLPGAVNVISFCYDGARWVQTGSSAGM